MEFLAARFGYLTLSVVELQRVNLLVEDLLLCLPASQANENVRKKCAVKMFQKGGTVLNQDANVNCAS